MYQLQNEEWREKKHAGKSGCHEEVNTCSFKVDQIVTQ